MNWTHSLRLGSLGLVAALLIPGCIKSDEKVTLAKDGSGSISIDFVIDKTKEKEFRDMLAAAGINSNPASEAPPAMSDAPAMEGDPAMGEEKKKDAPASEFSKEKMEKWLKKTDGNELKEYTIEEKDGKQSVHMQIAFKSFENLCKTGVLLSLAVTLVKNEDGSYALTIDPKGGFEGGGGMDAIVGMLPYFEPIVGGMEVKTELTVPGSIVETSGTKSEDGTKASWVIDWKAISGTDKAKKDATLMKASFKGEGIDIKPFSYKPDLEALAAIFGIGR